MAGLTDKEIRESIEAAVEVGTGMEHGKIVMKVHQGHIEDVYGADVKRAKRFKTRNAAKKGDPQHG